MPRYEVVWPKGVGFRTAPDLDAKAEDRIPAKRNDVIVGEAYDDKWVQTSDGLFLPLHTPDGRPLLKKVVDYIPWRSPGDDEPSRVETRIGSRPTSTAGRDAQGQLDALHQKYDKKYGRPRSNVSATPAALSHEVTSSYMHEFRHGLEAMGVDTKGDPYLEAYAPSKASAPQISRRPSGSAGAARRSNSMGAVNQVVRGGVSAGAVSAPQGSLALCGAMVITRSENSGSIGSWKSGPQNGIVP
eukprot:4769792-Amphidinium_carterae.1